MTFPVEHELYKKVKINNAVNLYVTQVSAGAMTSFSYHYYLYDAKKSDNDFMANVKNEAAFMATNDDKAITEVKEGQLYLRVHGNVYSFRNVSDSVGIYLKPHPTKRQTANSSPSHPAQPGSPAPTDTSALSARQRSCPAQLVGNPPLAE